MERIYPAIVLAICAYNVLVIGEPYCFHFTWIGSNNATINCTSYYNIPCIEPLDHNSTHPNMYELWNNTNMGESEYFCKMSSSNVCIKYTYKYNDAVVNTSYFCGKVIEDQTLAVTSGCYAQYTEGYTIEACTCRSKNETSLPCNASIRNTQSILIFTGATAVTLFMYKIFNIP